jgi:hypothetical protein
MALFQSPLSERGVIVSVSPCDFRHCLAVDDKLCFFWEFTVLIFSLMSILCSLVKHHFALTLSRMAALRASRITEERRMPGFDKIKATFLPVGGMFCSMSW